MALKTFRFVQGLSRTPLSFFHRYLTTRLFQTFIANKRHIENQTYETLKIPKPRLTNKCPDLPREPGLECPA